MTTVELGGLTFYGDLQDVPDILQFTDLDDWYSVPDSKVPVRERATTAGAFGIDVDLRASLPLSLAGWAESDTFAGVLTVAENLNAAVQRGYTLDMRVTDDLRATTRNVSVRRCKIREDQETKSLSYIIDVVALDPYRYGDDQVAQTFLASAGTGGFPYPVAYPITYGTAGTSTGRVTVINSGKQETASRFEVTGGMASGFQLQDVTTGQVLRFERSIPITSTVYLDSRTGDVYIDDPQNDVSGFLTRREWWTVPPGTSREIQFSTLGTVTGTPQLTARTASAF